MTFALDGATPTHPATEFPARIIVDLNAITENTTALTKLAPTSAVMAVVKADAYGHGLIPAARAAIDGGASWLGTAQISEALALRHAGYRGPLLAWLYSPQSPLNDAVTASIDLSVSAEWALTRVIQAAQDTGKVARVHLKIDTGLSRNGATATSWPQLVTAAKRAENEGTLVVAGIWSHFANADMPGHPSIAAQMKEFDEASTLAEAAGLHPAIRHIANSAATLTLPTTHLDMVRAGIAIYGLSPLNGIASPVPLRPAMRVEADLAMVKQVKAGTGVSYGHAYTTATDTTLALVPLGYGDGIPRHASGRGPILVPGTGRVHIAGRVCMDQFVIDLGPDATAQVGDCVTLFGDGSHGEPTADDWALAADTIGYEIVTRIAPRIPRSYLGGIAENSHLAAITESHQEEW